MFYETDITDWQNMRGLFRTAKSRFGQIDFVIANAGLMESKPFFEFEEDEKGELLESTESNRVIDVNLKGSLYTARIALGYIRQGATGGDIVLTSSISGFKECAGLTAYTASKHGVVGIVRGLNLASRKEDVRVNVVCPWMTSTSHRLYTPSYIRLRITQRRA